MGLLYRLAMFVIRRAQGRLAEIEGLVRDAADRYPGYRSFRCFIPVIDPHRTRGRRAPRYEELAQADFGAARDSEWPSAWRCSPSWPTASQDRERAALLYRMLRPYPAAQPWRPARSRSARSRATSASSPRRAPVGGGAATLRRRHCDECEDRRAPAARPHPGRLRPHARGTRTGRRRRARELRVAPPATCRALGMRSRIRWSRTTRERTRRPPPPSHRSSQTIS